MKFVFTPFSILLGLLAGIVGQKIFEKIWSLVDDEEPPSPEHREFSWPKMVIALLVGIVSGILAFRSPRSR